MTGRQAISYCAAFGLHADQATQKAPEGQAVGRVMIGVSLVPHAKEHLSYDRPFLGT
jgi:hypothetical protein